MHKEVPWLGVLLLSVMVQKIMGLSSLTKLMHERYYPVIIIIRNDFNLTSKKTKFHDPSFEPSQRDLSQHIRSKIQRIIPKLSSYVVILNNYSSFFFLNACIQKFCTKMLQFYC